MKRNQEPDEIETLCELEDGRIVPYDGADSELGRLDPAVFEYIGKGKIYSIGGRLQNYKTTDHFYKYRK